MLPWISSGFFCSCVLLLFLVYFHCHSDENSNATITDCICVQTSRTTNSQHIYMYRSLQLSDKQGLSSQGKAHSASAHFPSVHSAHFLSKVMSCKHSSRVWPETAHCYANINQGIITHLGFNWADFDLKEKTSFGWERSKKTRFSPWGWWIEPFLMDSCVIFVYVAW